MKMIRMGIGLLVGMLLASHAHAADTTHEPRRLFSSESAPLDPGSWYKLGRNFGRDGGLWQFGAYTGQTADGCFGRDLVHGRWLGGPCRDGVILAHRGQDAVHAGFMVGYTYRDPAGPSGKAVYLARLGVNIGPATAAAADFLADRLPPFEALVSWTPPKWLGYVGKVSTLDGMGDPFSGSAGVSGKVTIPLNDIWSLISGGK